MFARRPYNGVLVMLRENRLRNVNECCCVDGSFAEESLATVVLLLVLNTSTVLYLNVKQLYQHADVRPLSPQHPGSWIAWMPCLDTVQSRSPLTNTLPRVQGVAR